MSKHSIAPIEFKRAQPHVADPVGGEIRVAQTHKCYPELHLLEIASERE
jgi:hypothetical protein